MSKSIGAVKSATVMFDGNMQLEKMNYNKICLLTGKNGSGKTLVMKNIWCLSVLSNYVLYNIIYSEKSMDLSAEAQFIYDNSFDNCDFNGYAEIFFDNGELKVELEKGRVAKVSHNFPDDLTPPSFPIYMSGQTRTFDSFIKYMQYKRALGITNGMGALTTDDMAKILTAYKLYDVLFIEQQLVKLNGKVISDELKKALKENYEITAVFDQILVDTAACTMVNYNRDTKESMSLTRYSAGEQSLLNMLLAAG